MTEEILHWLHHTVRRHQQLSKEGIGTFALCSSRLPWGRVHVRFRPDFTEAGWNYVPEFTCADGELLIVKMLNAGNAFHAMSLLRGAYDAITESSGAAAGKVRA